MQISRAILKRFRQLGQSVQKALACHLVPMLLTYAPTEHAPLVHAVTLR